MPPRPLASPRCVPSWWPRRSRAGEKDLATSIGALRKPTVAAWAVNHFVREHGDELEELRSFAELLREAQRTLDADQLRLLGRERAKRVDALADRIAEVAAAGRPEARCRRRPGGARDADGPHRRRGGRGVRPHRALVKALSYSGFGSVDVEDVVALGDGSGTRAARRRPPPRPSLSVLPGGEAATPSTSRSDAAAGATAERARLQSALETARAELRAADRQVAVLTARQEEVTEGIADLERRLATARARLEKVTGELDEAGGIRDRREREEATAQEALDAHDDDP